MFKTEGKIVYKVDGELHEDNIVDIENVGFLLQLIAEKDGIEYKHLIYNPQTKKWLKPDSRETYVPFEGEVISCEYVHKWEKD